MRAGPLLSIPRNAFTARTCRFCSPFRQALQNQPQSIISFRSASTRPRYDPRLTSLPTDSTPESTLATRSSKSSHTTEPPPPLPRSINPSTALLLLTVPYPPSSWPAKLEFASPLLALASRSLKSKGVVVNAVWDGVSRKSDAFGGEGDEVYPATLFWPDGASVAFERFSKETILSGEAGRVLSREVDRQKALSPGDVRVRASRTGGNAANISARSLEILVCTHGSRDCRCGDVGGELVAALKPEIARRGMEGTVKVGEVAHVGGHKYAANAILLPSLDMLSNLRPEHVPGLLTWWLAGRDKTDDMWQFWRGRYGLSELEQAGIWGGTGWAHGEEKIAEKPGMEQVEVSEPVERVKMKFRTYEGETRDVEASLGETLLVVGKREGLPAIEGVCGGKLECATCHVYIPTCAPVPEASEAELDMLGYALGYRDGESRLGCQICVTRELAKWAEGDGGVVSLPRY